MRGLTIVQDRKANHLYKPKALDLRLYVRARVTEYLAVNQLLAESCRIFLLLFLSDRYVRPFTEGIVRAVVDVMRLKLSYIDWLACAEHLSRSSHATMNNHVVSGYRTTVGILLNLGTTI